MSQPQENARPDAPDEEIPLPGHPSQAEGEDPDRPETGRDPVLPGHPSQAEGEDDERADVGDGRGGAS
ncbi:hypothetical protein [Microbacterium sp. 8M]|jgi:hypothetical protein|uniref:hypothetical protein n=1 Tax=Microbacterium sp. 8M TaxID=2653153 RepID=UPI00135CAC29|nr:hypothetical protein [Microbacterium sp. 8M]